MKVIIKETNKEETLEFIDPRTGIDWVTDFIGNYGALDDGQFEWDEELDAYLCDQETFDWWEKVVTDNEDLEDRIVCLTSIHGDQVYAVLNDAGNVDLEDHARLMNTALDEAFGDE